MAQIYGFGASVLQGVGASRLGWFDLLKEDLHHKMYSEDGIGESYAIFNLGVAGHTTAMILDRLENEIQPRINNPKYELAFVFSAGLNDSKAVKGPDDFVNTPEQYEINIRKIVDIMRRYGQKILFVGLTPVDESRLAPNGNGSYFWIDRIRIFDQVLENVAKELNILHVPLLKDMLQKDYLAMLYKDGLHPNDGGHEWIAEQVKPELYKLLGVV